MCTNPLASTVLHASALHAAFTGHRVDLQAINVYVQVWGDYTRVPSWGKSKQQNEMEGPQWRKTDKQFFWARKHILDEVERIARVEEEATTRAAELLEQRRKERGLSLTALQKLLQAHKGDWMQHAMPVNAP